MKYDIYFHNDLDGRASAAVLLKFLEGRGDAIERYIPVDFDIESKWKKMKFPAEGRSASRGGNPAIVVDFLYHPKAAFWFDHHPTTFKFKEWKRNFRPSKFRVWNPKYPSCCHLILDSLVANFGFKPPRHFRDLVKWLDVLDGGNYESPKQTVEMKEPAFQIEQFINKAGKDPLEWLIRKLAEVPLVNIAQDPGIRKVMKRVYKERDKVLRFYLSHLQIYDRVAFIDLVEGDYLDLRYAPYHFYPFLLYVVFTKKHGREFGVHAGVNPWRRRESNVHIGKLMSKYGGGGHKVVGGLRTNTKAKAKKITMEIVNFLRKK